ncbi:hypothetical protein HZC08_02470 [Candidatus Micrarchaeota archaeon]|nr:hypothetical protein [Candidatus Micrarchaeota archaeon]
MSYLATRKITPVRDQKGEPVRLPYLAALKLLTENGATLIDYSRLDRIARTVATAKNRSRETGKIDRKIHDLSWRTWAKTLPAWTLEWCAYPPQNGSFRKGLDIFGSGGETQIPGTMLTMLAKDFDPFKPGVTILIHPGAVEAWRGRTVVQPIAIAEFKQEPGEFFFKLPCGDLGVVIRNDYAKGADLRVYGPNINAGVISVTYGLGRQPLVF